jgi:LPS-assembly lipoprotein
MSSCSRRHWIAGAGALILLGGCGFTPVDAPATDAPGWYGRIAADPIDSREGFILAGRLEQRLGRPGPSAPFRLAVMLEIDQEAMAITTQNEIDRFNLIGRAEWRLYDAGSGATVALGSVSDFTAYSATASTAATLSAERNAFDRLVRSLADKIVTDLVFVVPVP